MLEQLTRDSFASQLNTPFLVQYGDSSISIELLEASELQLSDGYESFSLVFRGPLDAMLPQALYPFQHATLGIFDLFITPIRKNPQDFAYEAVFNRRSVGA